ncbi:methionyl-tRNA synthetase [Alkalihalobacillus xiaoxiensis]|uniref:Methionine--tRNA ligase n=1 Tax=Shouchella xiaoxiensis TaxID=766895 RepID=A0ABS2SUI4_9BACI|nr:methionine--tRNA ligase [Shouchella xiaoxiensis]MBM7839213.1 methionyl-tRNA synthetase [Shouchella xiaoxiensis]
MNVFIGGAWPYANGSLHVGHVASLLPGDLLARYYRQKGDQVLYVSGSDCNGTPISVRARQEGVPAETITNRYHTEFVSCFKQLGFSFDHYTHTDEAHHHETVQSIFQQLYKNNTIELKEVEQAFCNRCDQFLPDRFVEGQCPSCGMSARGDQCDHCATILEPLELLQKKCKLCGDEPTRKQTEHFYFKLSAFQAELERYLEVARNEGRWRENAIHLTERYLQEGLLDRAVSRDLSIGVPVPIKGYEDKKIYVWIEAVSGYYSASKQWAAATGQDDASFWTKETRSYYVHGKDNIPFHSIIWPAILLGLKQPALPTHIVSNEYVTIEKRKLSTSQNWAVWLPDMLKSYDPDSIRYFLTINAPENRDSDFSWREFVYSHNSELLGAYGNFVNRTLKFIEKSYQHEVPTGTIDPTFKAEVHDLYDRVGHLFKQTQFKRAVEEIFAVVRKANKYFDDQQPWLQVKHDDRACRDTLATCTYLIANLAQLLAPILPFSSEKICEWLSLKTFNWQPIELAATSIPTVAPLFKRIDVGTIETETKKLNQQPF